MADLDKFVGRLTRRGFGSRLSGRALALFAGVIGLKRPARADGYCDCTECGEGECQGGEGYWIICDGNCCLCVAGPPTCDWLPPCDYGLCAYYDAGLEGCYPL